MLAPAGPNWGGSPQHFVAGAVLALAVTLVASRWNAPWWLAATIGVGVTCTAEIALKFAEYLYVDLTGGTIAAGAYYDSLVDNTTDARRRARWRGDRRGGGRAPSASPLERKRVRRVLRDVDQRRDEEQRTDRDDERHPDRDVEEPVARR